MLSMKVDVTDWSSESLINQLEESRERGVPLVVRINPGVNVSRFDPNSPHLARVKEQALKSGQIVVG
eukprot:746185-Hanusia_phi.AAC.2